MPEASDAAALSSVRAQLDDLTTRITAIADRYGASPDSAVASDLYAAERSLAGAIRSVERAAAALADLAR